MKSAFKNRLLSTTIFASIISTPGFGMGQSDLFLIDHSGFNGVETILLDTTISPATSAFSIGQLDQSTLASMQVGSNLQLESLKCEHCVLDALVSNSRMNQSVARSADWYR